MQLPGFRTCSWDLAQCSVASAECSNKLNERCHGDALRLLCRFVPWKHPGLYSTDPWKETGRQPLESSWEVARKTCCLDVASSHPQMEWVPQSPANKLNKSAKMTVQCPASTHRGTERDLVGGCRGLGTAMRLEEPGLAEDAGCCCSLFLDPGTGACGIVCVQSLKNWCWRGASLSRRETKQTLSWGGREALSPSPASDRLRHLERGDSAPAVPASISSSSSGPRWLPSPGLCSSSPHPGRQLFVPISLGSELRVDCCPSVSNKPLYFRPLRTKQSCAGHHNSLCTCLCF